MKTQRAALPLFLIFVCAVTVICCLLCYQYDNKYTAPRLDTSSGAVHLSEQILAERSVVMLVDGWEIYGGQLLSPQDFYAANPLQPDRIAYIGQFRGFESYTDNGSPHGSVTYRLILDLPDAPRFYTLELPEIFSAYRAYVDGALLAQLGEPDPENYRPETLNTTVTFEAAGKTEIVIAATDFSHIYSGMIYPPAFGTPEAVSQLLSARFLFRALLCVAALVIGLFAVLVGLISRRSRPALIYGLICLFFVGSVAYPLVKTFFRAFHPFYALENLSFCAMLVMVGVLLHGAAGIRGKRALVFPLFGGLVCAGALVMHLLLAGQGDNLLFLMNGYSRLITFYIWATAAYLTFLSVSKTGDGSLSYRGRDREPSPVLLAGIVIFDTALIMDRILPLHAPIVTGWFPELASFALVLCIGITVGAEVAQQYKNSAVQSERARNMEQLLQTQQSYYMVLDEKMENTRALRHDLRHHVAALDWLIAGKQYEQLKTYLSGFKQDVDMSAPKEYSKNRVVNVLANHYEGCAARRGVRFDLRCDLEGELSIPAADLSALLCNLMENALEACGRMDSGERFIRAGIAHAGDAICISVANSADAGPTSSGDGRFMSSKADGRIGYGLYSVRMIAKKLNGQSNTAWDEANRTFTHSVTLLP